MKKIPFPKRTIHLDFHTGPDIPDIAADFNAAEFAQTFKNAHVDSVTIFGTCHHGHAYYRTRRPERHPHLKPGFDLTGSQIKALHAVGIQAPIYLSVQVNEYCANAHPEWVAVDPNGAKAKRAGPFQAGWQVMDMSSPYADYLAEQLEEVLRLYAPVDGIFMDMCWDQPSISKWAIAGMLKRGYDPADADSRDAYAREVAQGYMKRFSDMAKAAGVAHGIWFNSRPKTRLHIEKKYLKRIEVEALPTGGWGYSYFPYVARFVRPLGLPTLSHTGRFFKSWGDNASLKPEMALKYECCQILSQGMTNGVGDLLHPQGVPQKAVYDLIGKVYSHIEKCEPFVDGAKHLSQIAVIVDPELGDKPGPSGVGLTRALQQLKHQFDVLPPSGDWSNYELVIIPETTRPGSDLISQLKSYLKSGGKMIVCGPASLDDRGGPIIKELGITTHGTSPYSHTFLRAAKSVSKDLARYDYVMYEKGFRMKPAKGATPLVKIVEPFFERSYLNFSGHSYTPPKKGSPYSAAVLCGNVITFSVPIFEAYGNHAAPNYRTLLRNCIDLLLPNPILKTSTHSGLETVVVVKGSTTVVHLLSFSPERRAENLDIVEDAFPLVNAQIQVKTAKAPKSVSLQPHGDELEFLYENGYVSTSVTLLDGHGMLVIK